MRTSVTSRRAQLKRLVTRGVSQVEIAAVLRVTRERVRQLLHETGLYARWRGRQTRRLAGQRYAVETSWRRSRLGRETLSLQRLLTLAGHRTEIHTTGAGDQVYFWLWCDGARVRLLFPKAPITTGGTAKYFAIRCYDPTAVYVAVLPNGERHVFWWPHKPGASVYIEASERQYQKARHAGLPRYVWNRRGCRILRPVVRTHADMLVAVLGEDPDRAFTRKELMARIGRWPGGEAFARLLDRGLIERAGWGEYQLGRAAERRAATA